MNSPPLLLPPPLVINRDRVRTIAAAPLPPRSVKIALCKNQAARVGCCVFFLCLSLLSLSFIWSVGKKIFPERIFFVPKNQHRNQIDERLNVGINFAVRKTERFLFSYVGISGIRGNFVRHRSIRTEST